ncbi:MAG: nicotinamide mononucleotide transporter [Gammaproteobacteria bacterium]|nr:nicotinamide mononucleotide transporter [Gammaproteobacteria bacterium]
MLDFINTVITELRASSHWELLAVVLAIAYLVLAMRQNSWCWPAAFFSTMIYTVLFWNVSLLMESVLNGYYLLMAVYGWLVWRNQTTNVGGMLPGVEKPVIITSWSLTKHLKIIGILTLTSLVLGYIMSNYTSADFAYLDAATTVFSVFTTWMVTQKILENWLYWLVIDAASIYLYLEKSFNLTAGLFMIYCVLAVVGYLQWRRQLHNNAVMA